MPISYAIIDPVGTIAIENFDIEGLPGNITVKEINIVESLLSPAIQVMAVLQSDIYNPPGKDFDQFKNKTMSFTIAGKSGLYAGRTLTASQKTYRLDNRFRVQNNMSAVEEMTFHATDETVLKDAKTLVSKSWKCTTPDKVVKHVLSNCLNAQNMKVDSATPARDYIAENIHPFQIITQQANVALDGDDPSFIHFMTLDTMQGNGVHHFQSLKKLSKQDDNLPVFQFSENTDSEGYPKATSVINFSFPCDFDYLSDLLNGLDENNQNLNSLGTVDQVWKIFNKMTGGGGGDGDCGIGGANYKLAQSNKSTADSRNSCNLDVESHLLKRQARMGLLEKDKIALRITVPWNPDLHAGKVINFMWENKTTHGPVYGHGSYLISSLIHNVRMGGYATTTMECVSTTVGMGVV